MKKVLVLVLVVAGGLAAFWFRERGKVGSSELRLRTGKVERGQVTEGVAANGQVEPFLLVQVGTQVSGVVERLYKDWNDKVKAGEVVALIDSRRFVAQVAQDHASLGQARANVERVRAQLVQAEKDLVRQRQLAAKKLVAESDLDAAVANADALRAQLDVNAAVVSQSLAQLDGDQINLKYCTITAPIDGIIVSRNVDVGQTVAASFNTPTLFQVANDLTKIQVQAQVPEAELGRVKVGQRAPFQVDAYPETFEGVVSQIRLAATTVNNVVTYTVLIDAENPKSQLLPGMTANATFEVAKSDPDALLVPVAALRFTPTDDIVTGAPAPDASASPRGEGAGSEGTGNEGTAGEHRREAPDDASVGEKPRGERGQGGGAGANKHGAHKKNGHHGEHGTVYVRADADHVKPIRVRVGVSDGIHTAVVPVEKGALAEGTEVVLSLAPEEEEAARNPFMPTFNRGGKHGGGH